MAKLGKADIIEENKKIHRTNGNGEITAKEVRELNEKMIESLYPEANEEITFFGHPNVADGTRFNPTDDLWRIVKAMAGTPRPATYTNPTASLSLNKTQVELGEVFDLECIINFVQNDAGEFKEATYTLNEDSRPQVQEKRLVYEKVSFGDLKDVPVTAEVFYADGPQKTDQAGNPSGEPIKGGSISTDRKLIKVSRKAFYQKTGTIPVTSAQVRALTGSSFDNQKTIVIPVAVGDKDIVLALAPGMVLDTVVLKQSNTFQLKDQFKAKPGVEVLDASGNNGVSYQILHYTQAVPFSAAGTITVTFK